MGRQNHRMLPTANGSVNGPSTRDIPPSFFRAYVPGFAAITAIKEESSTLLVIQTPSRYTDGSTGLTFPFYELIRHSCDDLLNTP